MKRLLGPLRRLRRPRRRHRVLVSVANCRSVSTTAAKATEIFRRAISEAGDQGVPGIVLGMECSKVDAERVADDHGWDVVQLGALGSPESALVVAWNRDVAQQVGKPRLLKGTPAGDGMRARPALRVRLRVAGGRSRPFTAGHTPADRAARLRALWLALVTGWRGILGADFNTRPDELARRFVRKVLGVRGQVLALLVPKGVETGHPSGHDIGSDHLRIDVPVHFDLPTKKGHQR